ncbi:monocarboxylate transporter 9-like [Haliotis cracherodii]|uniref:monocarboxylate transporter 9-like n=1 Tax=Haliotis cracherodii TaxID=6455 RepID=UPI0039E8284A
MDTRHRKDTDSGYAWVVLFAATFSNFIIGMLLYSPGVFNTAILEEVENDLSRTSWIGSTLVGTTTLSGPIAGVFTSRFGRKAASCLAGTLVLIGLSVSSFIKSVNGLLFTNGILTGLGAGLAINAAGTIPGLYFEKRLPLAFGVSTAGTAMGLFAGGPLVAILLKHYSLSGAFLIFGAIGSHLCVAGSLMRPRQQATVNVIVPDQQHDYQSVTLFVEGSKLQDESSNLTEEQGQRDTRVKCNIINNKRNGLDAHNMQDNNQIQVTEKKPGSCEENKCSRNRFLIVEEGNTMKADSTLLHSNTLNSNLQRRWWSYVKRNLPLITANGFLFYNISLMFLGLGENAILFHLPNYAYSKSSTRIQSTNLFTAMGLTSLMSRIFTGLILNDKDISIILLHVSCLGIIGILALVFPLYSHTYSLQMVFSALYGLYGGGLHSILSPMTVECVGVANLAVGFGVTHFAIGIGYILGPPVASIIYESSKVYDNTYFFGGGCLIAGSVCAAVVPVYRRLHGSS